MSMNGFNKIVLNIPHSSVEGLAGTGWNDMVALSRHVKRWTDWYTDALFKPKIPGVVPVRFGKSRFVCDVERLEDDPLEAVGQGIVYTRFEGMDRKVENKDALMRLYHCHIDTLKEELTPDSLLIDCHSFPSDMADVDVCIGYNDDWSQPIDEVIDDIRSAFESCGYKVGINTPYSNSISPWMPFAYPSVMIELNKRIYMDEDSGTLNEGFNTVHMLLNLIYFKLLDTSGKLYEPQPINHCDKFRLAESPEERVMQVVCGDDNNPYQPVPAPIISILRLLAHYGSNGFVITTSANPRELFRLIRQAKVKWLPLHKKASVGYSTYFILFPNRDCDFPALRRMFGDYLATLSLQDAYFNPSYLTFTDHVKREGRKEILPA